VTIKILGMVASLACILGILTGPTQITAFATTTRDSQRTTATTSLTPGDTTGPVKPVDPDNPGGGFQPEPGDEDNHGTGSTGVLTLDYVSNLTFKQGATTGQTLSATATNTKAFIQVSDRRYNGAGWKLTLLAGYPKGQSNGETLSQSSLAIGSTKFTPAIANTVSNPPVTTLDGKQPVKMGESTLVGEAGRDAGIGTWLLRLNDNSASPMRLFFNSAQVTRKQSYAGELTWQLTEAP